LHLRKYLTSHNGHKYKYELGCFDEPTCQHAADEPDRVQICICDPIDFVIKLGYSYDPPVPPFCALSVSRDWDRLPIYQYHLLCFVGQAFYNIGRRRMTLIHGCLLAIGRVELAGRYHCGLGYYPQQWSVHWHFGNLQWSCLPKLTALVFSHHSSPKKTSLFLTPLPATTPQPGPY
jgi:hypothetical protein